MTETMRTAERGGWSGWRIAGWGLAALLLAVPWAAMQVTAEVNWTPADFLFAAVMIGGAGLVVELAVRRTGNRAYRAGVALFVAAVFAIVWVNAAVGIIGTSDDPRNRFYAGVIAIGLAGAVMARFRAGGLARAAAATAVAQAVVGAIAVNAGGMREIAIQLIFHGGLVALFAGSAALFARAAQATARPEG